MREEKNYTSVEFAFVETIEKVSSVWDGLEIDMAIGEAVQVYCSIIQAVDDLIVVAVLCVFNHVICDYPRTALVISGAIREGILSVFIVIRENNLSRVSPVNARNIKWPTVFVLASSCNIAICQTLTQAPQAGCIQV
jgi:hypothetical protein